jgi:hypothetical protein
MVRSTIASAENMIKELETAKVDVTSASNQLKLAKSFNRMKDYNKALNYAKKALDTATHLKK